MATGIKAKKTKDLQPEKAHDNKAKSSTENQPKKEKVSWKGKLRGEHGVHYSSEYQPKNRGRKPKVFNEITREWAAVGYDRATPNTVKDIFEYMLGLPLSAIKEISGDAADKNNDYPILLRIIAKKMLTSDAQIKILVEMLDRAHGKAVQQINQDVKMRTTFTDGGQVEPGKIEAMLAAMRNFDESKLLNSGK